MYRVTATPLREGYAVSQVADGLATTLGGGAGRYRADVDAAVYVVRCVLPVEHASVSTVVSELSKGLPVVMSMRTAASTASDHICWPQAGSISAEWTDQRLCRISATFTAVRVADYPFDTEE